MFPVPQTTDEIVGAFLVTNCADVKLGCSRSAQLVDFLEPPWCAVFFCVPVEAKEVRVSA